MNKAKTRKREMPQPTQLIRGNANTQHVLNYFFKLCEDVAKQLSTTHANPHFTRLESFFHTKQFNNNPPLINQGNWVNASSSANQALEASLIFSQHCGQTLRPDSRTSRTDRDGLGSANSTAPELLPWNRHMQHRHMQHRHRPPHQTHMNMLTRRELRIMG